MSVPPRRVVVAITGASGAIYGVRALQLLAAIPDVETHLVLSNPAKTTIGVYSLRARERPTVSTPVTWDEVEDAASSRSLDDLAFEADAVLERIASHGDLYAPVLTMEQELPGPRS